MTEGEHEGHLGAVYAAKSTDEIARSYDTWAETYDADMAAAGYRHPAVCLGLLARHLPKGEGPILDAGCGTGLIGDWLPILGWPHAEGLDISEGMIAVAERKGRYQRIHRLALGTTLPFADGSFAAVVSTGVFTTGHVGPEGLDELVRALRPGGVVVITVKQTILDAFRAHIGHLPVTLSEETEPYVSMPGEEGTVPAVALVLKRS